METACPLPSARAKRKSRSGSLPPVPSPVCGCAPSATSGDMPPTAFAGPSEPSRTAEAGFALPSGCKAAATAGAAPVSIDRRSETVPPTGSAFSSPSVAVDASSMASRKACTVSREWVAAGSTGSAVSSPAPSRPSDRGVVPAGWPCCNRFAAWSRVMIARSEAGRASGDAASAMDAGTSAPKPSTFGTAEALPPFATESRRGSSADVRPPCPCVLRRPASAIASPNAPDSASG